MNLLLRQWKSYARLRADEPLMLRRRRGVRLLAVGAALAFMSAAVGASGGSPAAQSGAERTTTLVFEPVADARVEEANQTTNYGTATRLGSDGDAGSRIETYLRFDVAGVLGTVRSATLRLYVVADGTGDGPAVFPTGTGWDETAVTWATRPEATGSAVADMGAVSPGAWVELDVTAVVTGNGGVGLQLRQLGLDGVYFYSRQGSYRPQLVVTWADDPVVMAAGDIACRPGASVTATACRQRYTSDLLLAEPELAAVLALGDTQYEDGLYSEFLGAGAYDATWGRQKSVTRPAPGNHEYHVAGAPGYFQYFGDAAGAAGKGYYSFDIGTWHLIALNSEIATSAGSAQERWLRSDLAGTAAECTLAYWHRPRFSSGSHGGSTSVSALWQALYDARADVVLSAHDHDYERFALQSPAGQADAQGIREFVVGTGGASHSQFGAVVQPNSEVRDASTFGVLKLTLHASSYDWQFVPEAGGAFTDLGTTTCHDAPAAVLRVTPSVGARPLTVTADASRPAEPGEPAVAHYTFDFGDGTPLVGPQPGAIATHTYTADGTYTAKVTVTDTAGRTATATATVVVESNLVRNPGFEVDTAGWNASVGATLSRVAGGHTGEWAAAVANGGATAGSCLLNDSPDTVRPTATGVYTGRLWVRADTAGATLKLRLREWSGGVLVGSASTQATLDGSWQQVSVSYQPVAPGTSTLDFNAYVPNASPGSCFYADDASVSFAVPADSAPAAALSMIPSVGAAPLSVTADASSSTDPDTTPIATYAFDFGDGTPLVGPQPGSIATHTYTADGTYTAKVTVTDTAGRTATATATVIVDSNLVRNPGFETDASGWNTGSGAANTLTRVAGGHMGEWAAAVANGGGTAASCVLNDSPDWVRTTAAGVYTGSLWVRADTAGATLRLRFREWSGGVLAGSATTQVTLDGSWQKVSVAYKPVAPSASTLDFNAYVTSAPPGTCFYADDAMIFRD